MIGFRLSFRASAAIGRKQGHVDQFKPSPAERNICGHKSTYRRRSFRALWAGTAWGVADIRRLLSSGFQVGTLVERLLPEIGVLMLVPCGKEACGLPQYPQTPLRLPFDLYG